MTTKLGKDTGSLVNWLMAHNNSTPEVGKGATILLWSDRRAYEVMSVSENKDRIVIQQYLPERIDNNGISEDQEYRFEKLNGFDEIIVWKFGSWRREVKNIVFEKKFAESISKDFYTSPEYKEIFPNDTEPPVLIKGKTKLVTQYPKVNIIFGVKQEYWDVTF